MAAHDRPAPACPGACSLAVAGTPCCFPALVRQHTCDGELLTTAGLLQAEAHANLANALQQLGNFDMAVIYYQVSVLALHRPVQLWQRSRQAPAYVGMGQPPKKRILADTSNPAQLESACWLQCLPLTEHCTPWLLVVACLLPSPPSVRLLPARVPLCPAAADPCLPPRCSLLCGCAPLTHADLTVWHSAVAMPLSLESALPQGRCSQGYSK